MDLDKGYISFVLFLFLQSFCLRFPNKKLKKKITKDFADVIEAMDLKIRRVT